MHVLIIKNVFSEGPGTIADFLNSEKIPYSICEMSTGDAVPDLDSFTHLLVMGGPMAVYEMQQHPYLVNEALFIDRSIKANKHVLGVCLGAQMVAHVLGAKVYPGQQKEIGWYEVALSPDGTRDHLMSALTLPDRNAAQVFQWHGDTFDLPRGAVRLAIVRPLPEPGIPVYRPGVCAPVPYRSNSRYRPGLVGTGAGGRCCYHYSGIEKNIQRVPRESHEVL